MARIGEDLIAVLVGKGVIAMSDFPAEAVAKIERRQALRAALPGP